MNARTEFVAGEAAMLDYGIAMSKRMARDELVFLEGELGAGKTTLARGILRGLGFVGHVKSPTYTLVEHTSSRRSACITLTFIESEMPKS